MAFPGRFEKTIGSINFIPGIYLYGVSFLTLFHFRVPSLIFGPLVANNCGSFFLYFPNFFHKLLRYLKCHDTLVGKMMPRFFWNKVFLKNSHLCSTRLQNRNLYWVFLDEVGRDQSGDILFPFMGTACYKQNLHTIMHNNNFCFEYDKNVYVHVRKIQRNTRRE